MIIIVIILVVVVVVVVRLHPLISLCARKERGIRQMKLGPERKKEKKNYSGHCKSRIHHKEV